MIETKNDSELLKLWQRGDPRGFSELYKKYRNRVFGFLMKMTCDRERAQDLLQDTFLAAYRNIDQFDRKRSILSWIFGIAHKRAIDFYRHTKVEAEHEVEALSAVGSKIDGPEESFSNKQVRDWINEAVTRLDPLQREVFLLREVGGVPFKEIALIMECPLNTALGRMRLALRNIRKYLEQRGLYGVSTLD